MAPSQSVKVTPDPQNFEYVRESGFPGVVVSYFEACGMTRQSNMVPLPSAPYAQQSEATPFTALAIPADVWNDKTSHKWKIKSFGTLDKVCPCVQCCLVG